METLPVSDPVILEENAQSVEPYLVRLMEPNEWQAWDNFVTQSPQGTMFHSSKWLGATGVPFRIYGCFKGDSLVGGIAVEIMGPKIAGHSHFTTSTPEVETTGRAARRVTGGAWNCPYLGIVLPPPSKKYVTTFTRHRNISKTLVDHVTNQFKSIHSRMGPNVIDMDPFLSAGYSLSIRYTYRIDLSDLGVVWGNMTDKRRNDIRKAERDGITVDDQGSMEQMSSLLKGTFQRQRVALRFSEMADRRDQMLRDNNRVRCFLARDRSGEAVAGIYMVWDEKCAYYMMGGYGVTAAHRGAGALAIWEAIRYAGNTLSLPEFDMMGGGSGPIERFMRDFGGRLTAAFVVEYHHPSFSRDVKRVFNRVKAILGIREL